MPMWNHNSNNHQVLLKALNLQGRKVTKIVLTFEVNQPMSMVVHEYVDIDDPRELIDAIALEATQIEA